MSAPRIRLATADDAGTIAAIYAPFVTETAVSFEIDAPDAEEMERRIVETFEHFPWLVCEVGGYVAGYAYASRHRSRTAYQWSVDTAIYTHPQYRRVGMGRALYTSLLAALPLQGFYNAYAGIALPNAASVGLHEAFGFGPVGVYRQVGFKFGRWHDVGWWQIALQPPSDPASAPVPLADVAGSPEYANCLTRGLVHLRI